MPNTTVCVHVNSKYVSSDVYDLDVYDYYTLERAVMHCAGHINEWMELGKPEMAQPYVDFKARIKAHLGRN